jgi:acetyl-CoA decarbonylase/synthase complex subunit gamma
MVAVSNIDSDSTGAKFLSLIQKVLEITHLPLVLKSQNPDLLAKAAEIVTGSHSIVASATFESMNHLKSVAQKYGHTLVLEEPDLNKLGEMSSAMKKEGFTNILLNFQPQTISESFMINTIIRRAAITNEVKALGYPTLNFIQTNSPIENLLMTLTEIAKYGGVCVLPTFDRAQLITLLTLRMGIYTDPQKPIQVEPKIYPIGEPTKDSMVFVTTNFSLTFFIVSGEIENSGINAWLIIPECEGMSVLTAWAAGKFNAGTISKFIKEINLEEQINTREIIIPGYVAQISGELDELLPNWTIRVGPNDASDIESYITSLKNLKTEKNKLIIKN